MQESFLYLPFPFWKTWRCDSCRVVVHGVFRQASYQQNKHGSGHECILLLEHQSSWALPSFVFCDDERMKLFWKYQNAAQSSSQKASVKLESTDAEIIISTVQGCERAGSSVSMQALIICSNVGPRHCRRGHFLWLQSTWWSLLLSGTLQFSDVPMERLEKCPPAPQLSQTPLPWGCNLTPAEVLARWRHGSTEKSHSSARPRRWARERSWPRGKLQLSIAWCLLLPACVSKPPVSSAQSWLVRPGERDHAAHF